MNNYFSFIGRIARNLVLKETNDKKVIDVTLAITRKFKNAKGEYDTDFIKCKAFGKTAEMINEWCNVGDLICLSGRVQTSTYTNQEDKKVYATDFIISDIQFLVANKKEEKQEDDKGKEDKEETSDIYQQFAEEHDIELDLPF